MQPEHRQFRFRNAQPLQELTLSASQNSTTAPATQAVQHSTSEPKDIRMSAFFADSDTGETGYWWKKWKTELLTRVSYSGCIDALHNYG